MCDVAPDSYQGECLNIVVEYRELNGIVIFSCEIKKLLRHIRNELTETLSKYYTALRKNSFHKLWKSRFDHKDIVKCDGGFFLDL